MDLLAVAPFDTLAEQYDEDVLTAVTVAFGFVAVYLIGTRLVVPSLTRLVAKRNPNNPTVVQAVENYLWLSVLLVAVLVAVAVAGFGHVLTGSAVIVAALTLTIGVAGQAVIGNLLSGLFLIADPDFNVDDWIAWSDGEGTVESIRFRVTRVRNPNNEVVIVPNSTLTTTEVTRPYGRQHYRITARLGISFEDDIDATIALLREEIRSYARTLDDPPPDLYVEELGDDAVWIHVQFWIDHPARSDVMQIRSRFLLNAKRRLESADITVSPPSEYVLSGSLSVDQPDW